MMMIMVVGPPRQVVSVGQAHQSQSTGPPPQWHISTAPQLHRERWRAGRRGLPSAATAYVEEREFTTGAGWTLEACSCSSSREQAKQGRREREGMFDLHDCCPRTFLPLVL